MSYGHIKLYRSLLDSKVFANEKSLKIWIWLLLKATFEKRFVSIVIGKGKHTVELMPGELIFGRFQAEEALCIDGSTIYKKLKEFEQEEMIMITSNSHYSIITICNWDIYQAIINDEVTANELPSNSQVTTNELPSNTYKKDNKVNKDKEIIIEYPENFSEKRKELFKTWFDYKSEQHKFRYKSDKSIKALFGEFESMTDTELEAGIQKSMAAGYKGIIKNELNNKKYESKYN